MSFMQNKGITKRTYVFDYTTKWRWDIYWLAG